MNEAETRAEYIDPALKAAGWGVVEGSRIKREFLITEGRILGGGKRAAAKKADYVLVYRNTNLAVVEAKAWNEPHTAGLAQAKDYAGLMAVRFGFASNGQAIYSVDMHTDVEGDAAHFPGPDELWQRCFAVANRWRDAFAAVPFEDKSGSWLIRYYQDIAVNRVLGRIIDGADRILLTLATGTGKTSIAFQIAWKLFRARWSLQGDGARQPRILFLADRNTLANQAFGDFASFAAFEDRALVRIDPEEIRKGGRVPKNGSVFFTIFQTFMSGPNETPYFGEYPPDFFDCIIIDECHRGGANDESSWRGILEYFAPAVQLGLTATPKRDINVDTYNYFGEPVYTYSLKDGINDGFLTPFKVKQISTTLDEYVYVPDDIVVEGVAEPRRRYAEADFNRSIEIKERERYRVQLFLNLINANDKTLVFCANQTHALVVRDLVNQLSSSRDPLYCVRVTADDGALGDQYLADFKDNERTIPTILTTSQKLSTGVDALNVRNIVLMRPVESMIEFKQIIGRGTRLYDGKDYFTIYDFVQAHHHFADEQWDGPPDDPDTTATSGGRTAALRIRPEPDSVARQRLKITLADGKLRQIQNMIATSYWHPDGRPMSAAEFLQDLFGVLPDFFHDEDALRLIWSKPDTRQTLLQGLAEKGFGRSQLSEMQTIIEAENCDLFDVLAHVAFGLSPLPRSERAAVAQRASVQALTDKQAAFVEFVLAQYVAQGVDELSPEKLPALIKLKYGNALSDAFAELGQADSVRKLFIDFQPHLYQRIKPTGSGTTARY
jgi:type I restriction enzyme, R subunit